MNNTYTLIAFVPLAIFGAAQMAMVKVPDGVSPAAFWGISACAAFLIMAIVAAIVLSRRARYAVGFMLVLALLVMAAFIVATMPPYVAPGA